VINSGGEIQNHSDFVALEIFGTAAAFTPDFGRKLFFILTLEAEFFVEILCQYEGE